jgi:hypothetical protein
VKTIEKATVKRIKKQEKKVQKAYSWADWLIGTAVKKVKSVSRLFTRGNSKKSKNTKKRS